MTDTAPTGMDHLWYAELHYQGGGMAPVRKLKDRGALVGRLQPQGTVCIFSRGAMSSRSHSLSAAQVGTDSTCECTA